MKVAYRKIGQIEEHDLPDDVSEIIITLRNGTRISMSDGSSISTDVLKVRESTYKGLAIHPIANNSVELWGDE